MGTSFTDRDLDYLRSRINIVELIGSYIPLKKSGANFKGLCPFHNEKTPSFMVSPEKQIFHCFGCHKGGDIFSFIMEMDNITFPEAVGHFANKCGYTLTGTVAPDQQKALRSEKQRLLDCMQEAAHFFHQYLLNETPAKAARDYLQHREIPSDAIKVWQLGFAPNNSNLLLATLKKAGFSEQEILKTGLIKKHDRSGRLVARFFNRIMFPIFDDRKQIVSFGGRVMDNSTPKYINCPETALYQKSKILYGFSHAKTSIKEQKHALVCEGYFDVIQLHQAGLNIAVAPCGTALTEEQISFLKRYTDKFYLAFDADQAGINATLRKLDTLLQETIQAYVLTLPEGDDPDSFIRKHGKEKFQKIMESGEPILDFRLKILISQYGLNDEYGRVKVAESMMELIAKQPNKLLAESWIKKIEQKIGFSEDVLRSEFGHKRKHYKQQQRYTNIQTAQLVQDDQIKIPAWEKEILRLLLHGDEEFLEYAKNILQKDLFSSKIIAHLWEKVLLHSENGNIAFAELLLDEVRNNNDAVSLITELMAESYTQQDSRNILDDAVKRLKRESLEQQIKQCLASLGSASGDEVSCLLKQLQTLKQEAAHLGVF